MRDWLWQAAMVTAVACIVMFTNLGGPRLWDRDEPRNAGCAREMLERNDWVVPVFNAELRAHKPVLLYWLMMAAYSVFGVSEFSARFGSALLAVGTCLCTYAIGRRLFNGRVGVWSGIALATCIMFGVAGRAATPDSPLIFFTTLSLMIYVLASFAKQTYEDEPAHTGRERGYLARQVVSRGEKAFLEWFTQARLTEAPTWFPRAWIVAALMYAVMGVAVLVKGPVGLVLPTAVIGMFLLIMRLPDRKGTFWQARLRQLLHLLSPWHFSKTCWLMRPVTALTAVAVVAVPWYFWVGLRTDGEFLRGFFLEHNFGRAVQSMEGHNGSLLFYPGAMLAGFFPWSVFAVPILIDTCRDAKRSPLRLPAYVFLACWVGVYVGLFSIAKTKLPSYVTPCYPALAIFAGGFVERWSRNAVLVGLPWRRIAFGVLIVVGLGLSVGLPFAAAHFLPGEEWLGVVGLIPVLGGVFGWWMMERGNGAAACRVCALAAIGFVTALFGLVAQRVDRHQQNHLFLSEIQRRGDSSRVAALGLLEPSWVFYGGQPVNEVAASGEAQWMGGYAERDGQWRRRAAVGLDDLQADPDRWLLITTPQHFTRLQDQLPDEFEVLVESPYFLKDQRLLMIGRAATPQVGRREPAAQLR